MPVIGPRPSTRCCTRIYEEFVIVFNGLEAKKRYMYESGGRLRMPTYVYDLTPVRPRPSALPMNLVNRGPPSVYIDGHV